MRKVQSLGWYIDANGAYHGYIYQYRGEDDSNVPEAHILKEPSGIDFGSAASACYPFGHYCKSRSQCCSNLCGSAGSGRCCDKPYGGQICTSNAECCFGICIAVGTNHMCSLGL